MIVEYRDFYAIQNQMPGADHALRVGGVCVFNTSGYSAHLEPSAGNTGINPLMLSLDLIVEEPDPGAVVLEVLTPVTLDEWRDEGPALEYQEVSFHIRGSKDDPPPSLKVDRPT